MKRDLLAIDTGNAKLGFAYWRSVPRKPVAPNVAGVIRATRKARNNQYLAALNAINLLRRAVIQATGNDEQMPHVLVLEGQEVRRDTVGVAAQSDIVNLSSCVGAMVNEHYHATNLKSVCEVILPREWKGQLKKEKVNSRIERMLGTNEDQQGNAFIADAWDAVGIGLYFSGHRIDDIEKVLRK